MGDSYFSKLDALPILVVEDDPVASRVLSDVLTTAGYVVDTAGDAHTALEQVCARRYGTLLLDMRLPDSTDGSALIRLLQLDRTLPAIVVTGYDDDAARSGSFKNGAFAYVTKPWRLEELLAIVERAVGVRQLTFQAETSTCALHESDARFRSVVESASDAIVLADKSGAILSWNAAAEHLFGYTAQEVVGRPLTLLMPLRYREAHQRGLARVGGGASSGVIGKRMELHGLRKDGTEFPLELSLGTWRAQNETCYSGIIRDITARKETEQALRASEERFRQVAENIDEVFWMSSPDKNEMLYVSPGYEKIWGRSCASLYAAPRSWLEAVHADDRNRILQSALTRQVGGTYDEEYRIVRPDGSVRWIHDRAFPIRDEEGRVYRIAGIAADISESKAAQDQLIQAEKLASVGTLVFGVAHEINNPMQGILGMGEVLLEETDQVKIKEYVNDIIQYTNHVATVVRELVAYARPASRDAEVDVDLRERLGEAVKMIHRNPSVAPVQVVSELNAIPLIRARRSEIDQIFVNLVSNAVQAMGGTGRLTVSAAMAGDVIRVRIVDTGPGIPKALINKVFDPFFTTKGPGKGTGLGLSIVQKLMKKYCGLIRIDSEEGFGTTVTLEFPFMSSAHHAQNVAEVEQLGTQAPEHP